jgi:hypothetical protein
VQLIGNVWPTANSFHCHVSSAHVWASPSDDLQEYVQLYKTPPDPEFYDVIYHSYGIVPALANPAYYTCKLTSAVITTLMTGRPGGGHWASPQQGCTEEADTRQAHSRAAQRAAGAPKWAPKNAAQSHSRE